MRFKFYLTEHDFINTIFAIHKKEMLKQFISIFFIALFSASIVLPSVILLVDDSIDTSFFYDLSEEEEEKGNEKNIEFEDIVIINLDELPIGYLTSIDEENLEYCYKKYPKPHLNLIYSPPEYYI